MSNPEYLSALANVVTHTRKVFAHHKLPDLTPRQIVEWFRTITVEDVESVLSAESKRKPTLPGALKEVQREL
jgi:hypothetical protein